MVSGFWRGFEKRAENLSLMSDDEATEPTPIPPMLERTVTSGGARLDELTMRMDQAHYGG